MRYFWKLMMYICIPSFVLLFNCTNTPSSAEVNHSLKGLALADALADSAYLSFLVLDHSKAHQLYQEAAKIYADKNAWERWAWMRAYDAYIYQRNEEQDSAKQSLLTTYQYLQEINVQDDSVDILLRMIGAAAPQRPFSLLNEKPLLEELQACKRLLDSLYSCHSLKVLNYIILAKNYWYNQNQSSAFEVIDTAITEAQKCPVVEKRYLSRIYLLKGVYHLGIMELEKVQNALKAGLEQEKKIEYANQSISQSLRHVHAIMLGKQGNYLRASKEFRDLMQEGLPGIMQGALFHNLGLCYRYMGDYRQAENYINHALRNAANTPHTAGIYNDLGEVYTIMGDYKRARFFHKKALLIREAFFGKDHRATSYSYYNLGQVFKRERQYDSARIYSYRSFDISMALHKRFGYADGVIQEYTALADIYLAMRQLDSANTFIQKALNMIPTEVTQLPHIGFPYFLEAKVHQLKKEYHQAIQSTYDAISWTLGRELEQNERLSKFENIPAPKQLFDAYIIQAECWADLYKLEGKIEYLENCFQAYLNALRMSESTWDYHRTEESRKIFSTNIDSLYDAAMQKVWQLAELKPEAATEYYQLMFQFSEQNKARIVKQLFSEAEIRQFAGLPEEVQLRQSDLETHFYAWRDSVNQLTNKENVHAYRILDQYQEAQRALGVFRDSLQTLFPQYSAFKFGLTPPPIDSIQQVLRTRRHQMIEYFVGDEEVYLFVITPDVFEVKRLEIHADSLSLAVRELVESIDPSSKGFEFKTYSQKAHQLYKDLLAPAEDFLQLGQHLYIIPDKDLSNLPFAALLTTEIDANADFPDIRNHYFIHRFSQSWELFVSAILQPNTYDTHTKKQNFLAIAPFTTEVTSWYKNMTKQEFLAAGASIELAKSMGGRPKNESLVGMQANKKELQARWNNFRILDFGGSHGELDKTDPLKAYIALAPNDPLDSFTVTSLFLHEIYNQRGVLKPDFVQLPICQTGIGEFQPGLGNISLANAFRYAGCSSIGMTLWKVRDQETSQINHHFYQNLWKGLDKAEALHQAQLSYLEAAGGEYLNPYFWAGIILLGNTDPIPLEKSTSYSYYLLAFGLLCLLALGIRQWSRK